MLEILHSFGAGIAFAAGVTVGAALCRIAMKEGHKEVHKAWEEHQKRVEDRLAVYAANSTHIAQSLAAIAKVKEEEKEAQP